MFKRYKHFAETICDTLVDAFSRAGQAFIERPGRFLKAYCFAVGLCALGGAWIIVVSSLMAIDPAVGMLFLGVPLVVLALNIK